MTPYYEADGVTLYLGDCRELLPTIDFSAVVTDPPYGIGANKMPLGNRPRWRKLERGERDWDVEIPDLEPLVTREVPMVVWGGNHFPLPHSRGWLVWDKQNDGMSFADCELAWTNMDMPIRRLVYRWGGSTAREKHEDRVHPTQKPVAVMRWCLKFVCGVEPPSFLPDGPHVVFGGPCVLDPYAGSGSTLIAARHMGLRAVGVEIEEKYCEMARQRLEQAEFMVEEPLPEQVWAKAAMRFDLDGEG